MTNYQLQIFHCSLVIGHLSFVIGEWRDRPDSLLPRGASLGEMHRRFVFYGPWRHYQPVDLVVLFLVPQGQFQKHLHTLAKIAKLLHKKEFRQALEVAPDARSMYAIIAAESGK